MFLATASEIQNCNQLDARLLPADQSNYDLHGTIDMRNAAALAMLAAKSRRQEVKVSTRLHDDILLQHFENTPG